MDIPVCQPGVRERRLNILLFAMLGLSLPGYWYAGFHLANVTGPDGVHRFLALFGSLFLFYAGALYALSARHFCVPPRTVAWFILAVGVCFRLLLLPAGIADGVTVAKMKADVMGTEVVYNRFLMYDHDVWRFLWDGRQQAMGINPYQHAPMHFSEEAAEETTEETARPAAMPTDHEMAQMLPDDRWRDIRDNINHPDLPTIYPPGLQLFFRIVSPIAPGSILVWKLALLLVDLGVAGLLLLALKRLNLPVWKLAVFFWNPLMMKEGVGTGHADALVALMLVGLAVALLREKPLEIGAWLAGAVLVKLVPIILLPFVLSRMKFKGAAMFVLVLVAGCVPFLDAGVSFAGLAAYWREWVFNPGIFELCRWTTIASGLPVDHTLAAKIITGTIFLSLLFIFRRHLALDGAHVPETLLLAIGGLLFFSPAVMPWYFLWITPLAALAGKRSWILYGALSLASYLIYADGSGIEPAPRLLFIHGGFLLGWMLERYFGARRRDPAWKVATA